MVGVCDVAMPPTIVAMGRSSQCRARPSARAQFACTMACVDALPQVKLRMCEDFAYPKRQRAKPPKPLRPPRVAARRMGAPKNQLRCLDTSEVSWNIVI